MKRSIASVLIFLLAAGGFTALSQGTWERLPVPTKHSLHSQCFTDSLYGWIVGDSGTILHTSDGGLNWTLQDGKTRNDIVSVFFLDRDHGWASAFNYNVEPFGTVLLKTADGGQNWDTASFSVPNIFVTCILYLDPMNGWMGGKPHALLRTKDGGATWAQAPVDTSVLAFFPVLKIRFYNARYGYACGGMFDIAGVIWRTDNGGDRWYALDPTEAPADEVHQLHFYDSLNVIGAGGDPDFGYGVGMIRTSDGGLHWNYTPIGFQGNAFDLDFRNDKEAWAPLGPQGKLIYSLDGGNTWTQIISPDSTTIYSLSFTDSLHGFASGNRGAFLKYRPPFSPGTGPGPEGSGGYALYPNYPNTFSGATTIRYHVPPGNAGDPLAIRVYDCFGRIVFTTIDASPVPGDHAEAFDPGNLPAGIYLCELRASDGTIRLTQRMIFNGRAPSSGNY